MNKSILKVYLYHLIAALFSVFLFLWLISYYLEYYTQHNKYIQTPNILHLPIKKAITLIQSKNLKHHILDSIYQPNQKPGIVISQNPEPNTYVKENRSIYLTITRFLPPQIEMPKLIDMSERQAIITLNSYNLKLGKIHYEPSYCNGCVINQLYQNKPIEPGKLIHEGSKIDLVVGKKGYPNQTSLPDTISTPASSFDSAE